MSNYSVLMTVYFKDIPEYAVLAIDSMLAQTKKTDDFVVVCDGPLTAELDSLLNRYQKKHSKIFNIVRLSENVGLGKALMIGLTHCKNEFVARMDDDDIAIHNRCEKQIAILDNNNEISIVGSYMDEFENDHHDSLRTKYVPIKNEDIIRFSKRRNPFNHSTVMFRKSAVIAAGNYSDMRTNQDVELWIRMLNIGYAGYNIPESLVLFRFNSDTYKRRKNYKNIKLMISTWKDFKKKKYCTSIDYFCVFCTQIIIFLMPQFLLKFAYRKSRKKINP